MTSSRTRADTHLFRHCSKLHERRSGAETVTEVDALEQGAARARPEAQPRAPVMPRAGQAARPMVTEQVMGIVTPGTIGLPQKASLILDIFKVWELENSNSIPKI